MKTTIQTLVSTEPRYFMDKAKAFEVHNTEGGKLWKRREDAPSAVKPWATGDLQPSRLDWYELHSVDGRKP